MHLGLAGGRRDQTKPREWLNTDQGKGGAGEKIKFKNHKGIFIYGPGFCLVIRSSSEEPLMEGGIDW